MIYLDDLWSWIPSSGAQWSRRAHQTAAFSLLAQGIVSYYQEGTIIPLFSSLKSAQLASSPWFSPSALPALVADSPSLHPRTRFQYSRFATPIRRSCSFSCHMSRQTNCRWLVSLPRPSYWVNSFPRPMKYRRWLINGRKQKMNWTFQYSVTTGISWSERGVTFKTKRTSQLL
jgi:hypothetical protein